MSLTVKVLPRASTRRTSPTTSSMGPRSEYLSTGVSRNFPTNRDLAMGRVEDWLLGKQKDDGAEGLWRIHDDLYDLTTWVTKHPGGRDWIELTRGTDITEAFEVHHISDRAEHMLPKFHVRKATTPRNSLVTFNKDGFYKTLKKRIQPLIGETGPTWQTTVLTDSLLACCLLSGVLGALYSQWWSILAGVFLHMVVVCSHNFFHMKDNFRMYYFNISLMNYREWRISHVLSHHMFPNSILDLEISMWEPIFQYLPKTDKTHFTRFFPWIFSPIAFITMFHLQFVRRIIDVVFSKRLSFYPDEIISFLVPLFLYAVTGTGLLHCFITSQVIILSASSVFGIVGLTAAHHHPDIYHEGDHLGNNKDFAIVQLAAVRDRVEVNGNFFLTMISFGDHALHHMFPTIDHHRLTPLYPVFYQTCKEFGIEFKLVTASYLFYGMYTQLARNYTNAKLYIEKTKSK